MSTLWRPLLSASLDSNSHLNYASYFQLATVKPDGRPANRTVVFRGFVEGTDKLQVTTDSRTHKIEEISHCPHGEICWYFTDSWEQFRIQGKLDIIGEKDTDPVRCLVDYLNLKTNRRIVFKRLGGDVDVNCQWMQQEVNP